ncbi:MAG: hypothetical protein AAAC48_11955 [Phyllobacterium sp.]|uniref:hypothetical protein n=1 Tax=Phyllobacterium sp. TaxID=1871046 RepID=UPI0030F0CA96
MSKIAFASPPLARPKAKSCQFELGVVPARVVTLDEIRIVSIHHPDEVSEFCRRFWMEAAPQVVRLSLQFHREVAKTGGMVAWKKHGSIRAGVSFFFADPKNP